MMRMYKIITKNLLDIDMNMPIFRYMSFEHLLSILETKKLRINYRGSFSDSLEKKLNLKYQFALQVIGDNASEEINKYLKNNAVDISVKSGKHKGFCSLPASCWTLKSAEDALMWSSYTKGIGVRISSTVGNFFESIKPDDINCSYASDVCLYGPIEYRIDAAYQTAEDNLFIKHPAFKNEEEFRFYICRITDDSDILPSTLTAEYEGKRYIEIPIKPEILIKSVTISPNLNHQVAKKIANWLANDYGLSVKFSTIKFD